MYKNDPCSLDPSVIDRPTNQHTWRDSEGYSCGHYEANQWCSDGGYGSEWKTRIAWSNHTDFASYASEDGLDASQICCSCMAEGSDTYRLNCANYEVSTIDEWRDQGGHSCRVYVEREWCQGNGEPGLGWNEEAWGLITRYSDAKGIDALDVCCGCMDQTTAEFNQKCVEFVDGSIYQTQHIVSIALYGFVSIVILALLIISGIKKIRKKKGCFVCDLTNISLLGSIAFISAKSGAYFGNLIRIGSDSFADQMNGRTVTDILSTLLY